jgi:hypothetical protein
MENKKWNKWYKSPEEVKAEKKKISQSLKKSKKARDYESKLSKKYNGQQDTKANKREKATLVKRLKALD